MTRKDYALLAEALRVSRPVWGALKPYVYDAAVTLWVQVRYEIANRLQADNPNFDREKFYAATEE